jgi:hypothetical protein
VDDAPGDASANDGGLVRKPEKKYAYAPTDPSTTNATTETTGIQTLRDIPADPVSEGLSDDVKRLGAC